MPITDWDGTTQLEIGSVYDWNGSATTQIGKVYDWNGTTNSLIYTSETTLFPGSSVYTGGWGTYGANSTNCAVTASYLHAASNTAYTNGKVYSAQPINMTGINYITFTVTSTYSNGNSQVILGVSPYLNIYTVSDSWTRYVQILSAGEYTLDVRDLTSSLYVIASCWGSTGDSICTVTKILIS